MDRVEQHWCDNICRHQNLTAFQIKINVTVAISSFLSTIANIIQPFVTSPWPLTIDQVTSLSCFLIFFRHKLWLIMTQFWIIMTNSAWQWKRKNRQSQTTHGQSRYWLGVLWRGQTQMSRFQRSLLLPCQTRSNLSAQQETLHPTTAQSRVASAECMLRGATVQYEFEGLDLFDNLLKVT